MCGSRDYVERAWRGRPERGGEGIVAHREVLRVIPQRGDRVAVEVAHDDFLAQTSYVAAWAGCAESFDKPGHEAAVIGLLLVGVLMVLIAGNSLSPG